MITNKLIKLSPVFRKCPFIIFQKCCTCRENIRRINLLFIIGRCLLWHFQDEFRVRSLMVGPGDQVSA